MMWKLVSVLAVAAVVAGCVDIRKFDGAWTGAVVSEEAVREGFDVDVRAAPLELSDVDLDSLSARLTTSDGRFTNTPLARVVKFSNDTLASLTFDGAPLRSYLMFAAPGAEPGGADADAGPAMMVISLFADEHVELRILRGNDLFGVFGLVRQDD